MQMPKITSCFCTVRFSLDAANVIAKVCPVHLSCVIHTGVDTEALMLMNAGDCHGIEGASAGAAGRPTLCLASRSQSSCCLHSRRPCPGATSCHIVLVLTSRALPGQLPLHSCYCLLVSSLSSYNTSLSPQPEECVLHRVYNNVIAACHVLRQS